jgi:hypothetical protein
VSAGTLRAPPVRRARLLLGIGAYGVLALAAYWPVWPGRAGRVPWCACDDTAQAIWFLRWTPFALAHAHNLFATNAFDAPLGVNLAQNTSMPLLGLLAAPLTLLRGPVASFNALLWLGLVASATSCFLVLRHWIRWTPAAFVGGLLYGFSSYMAGQALGHLNLIFIPIPPLLFLVLNDIVVEQRHRIRRSGLALGLLAAAQFLISPEILIDSALLAVLGVVFLALARPREVAHRLGHAGRALTLAVFTAVPFVAYPVVEYLAGPARYQGSPWHGVTYAEDLLGSVVPTLNQRVTTAHLAAFGTHLQMDLAENGAYLGIPLLLILGYLLLRYRREGVIELAGGLAFVALVLSLGPRLVVDGHTTAVRLPFDLFLHVPVLDSLLAGRFTLFVALFAAVVLAVGLDRLHGDLQGRGVSVPLRAVAVLAVAVVALVPLIPRWPYPVVNVGSTTPPFFLTNDVRAIPQGGLVLTYPYPVYPFNQAMLWQAEASMRFRILGGYALIQGADDQATNAPAPLMPPSVPATLMADFNGNPVAGPTASPADLVALVRRYDVASVVLDTGGVDPAAAAALFTKSFGRPEVIGGIELWSPRGCADPQRCAR